MVGITQLRIFRAEEQKVCVRISATYTRLPVRNCHAFVSEAPALELGNGLPGLLLEARPRGISTPSARPSGIAIHVPTAEITTVAQNENPQLATTSHAITAKKAAHEAEGMIPLVLRTVAEDPFWLFTPWCYMRNQRLEGPPRRHPAQRTSPEAHQPPAGPESRKTVAERAARQILPSVSLLASLRTFTPHDDMHGEGALTATLPIVLKP